MPSNFQSQLPRHREFQPGVHVINLAAAVKTNYVRQAFLDLRSQKNEASYCRFAFPILSGVDLDQALSQKLSEADKLFDWSHQVPSLSQKRLLISLAAHLGCLIVGQHRPAHELEAHALRFADAAFMESDLDDRFSRFIENLHDWALPPGIGDAFLSYSRCLTRERQIYTLMFLESGLNLIGKLIRHAADAEGARSPHTSFIILDGLDLFCESTDYADAFLCSAQELAVSAGVVVLGVSDIENTVKQESRHPSRVPAMVG